MKFIQQVVLFGVLSSKEIPTVLTSRSSEVDRRGVKEGFERLLLHRQQL